MMLRRLLALLTSITMLHLSVSTVDRACAAHPAAGPAMPASHVATHPHDAGATPDRVPCDHASHDGCCDALAACGFQALAEPARTALAGAVAATPRVSPAPDDAPASFAAPPEPPPPKR